MENGSVPENSGLRWPLSELLRPGRLGLQTGPAGIKVRARIPGALAELMPFKGLDEVVAKTIRDLHKLELPRRRRRVEGARLTCTWAGPKRWLVEAPAIAPPGPIEELEQHIAGTAALVRQTDGRAVLQMSGPKVREALRKGVAIDLHPRSFAPGDTALTLVAGIEVHLWQLDDVPTFELLISRSVADSFWDWLKSAAAEFGLECAAETSESTRVMDSASLEELGATAVTSMNTPQEIK